MKKLFIWLLSAAVLLAGCAAGAPAEETTETTILTEPTEVIAETITEPAAETIGQTVAQTTPAEPEVFTLTFAGDCTLGSEEAHFAYPVSFVQTIGDDYRYPFANVIEYFENDDFSMVNLETPLCDGGTPMLKEFAFRGPTDFVNILTQNSIQAVTLANNHSYDYGQEGYDSTIATLKEAGMAYVEADRTLIYTTDSGLTIGIYAATYDHLDQDEITAGISALAQDQGVDLVIFAVHWGIENSYTPSYAQQTLAHAAIDAGADIVYGSHPHVLQPIEAYNDGVIFYSLGNFSFGGNAAPPDFDTVFIQQEIIRYPDGSVALGERTLVPCSVSSEPYVNNYQPTPYAPDSAEYQRVMRKLEGTYYGGGSTFH